MIRAGNGSLRALVNLPQNRINQWINFIEYSIVYHKLNLYGVFGKAEFKLVYLIR